MNKTIYKTVAYDVRDSLTGDEFTVYWNRFAGVDFWNDLDVKCDRAGSVPPERGPSDAYERLSEMYEVEIEFTPEVHIPKSWKVSKI